MRNLLAYRKESKDSSIGQIDGKRFEIRSIKNDSEDKLEEILTEQKQVTRSYRIPLWIWVVILCFAIASVALITNSLFAISKVGYKNLADKRSFWTKLVVGLVLGLITTTLYLIGRYQTKRYVWTQGQEDLDQLIEDITNDSRVQLGIPEEAMDIDLISYAYYLDEKDKDVILSNGTNAPFINSSFWIYQEEDHLNIAGIDVVYSIPISSFKQLIKCKKRITINAINKPLGELKAKDFIAMYDIRVANDFPLIICYKLIIKDKNQGDFELWFPNYEIDTITSLIPLPMEEENLNKNK